MVEDIRERFTFLMQQEDRQYRCKDYMLHERPSHLEQANLAIQEIVEECAKLVTDLFSLDVKDASSDLLPPHQMHPSYEFRSLSGDSFDDSSPKSVTSETEIESFQGVEEFGEKVTNCSIEVEQSFTYWRKQLCDWAYAVIDNFDMDRQIVATSMNTLDRYVALKTLQQHEHISREDFQLYFMTCLYMNIKVVNTFNRKLGIDVLVEISRHQYTRDQIEATERDILDALDWRINAPTALEYSRLLFDMFPANTSISSQIRATCATLTELAVADSFFISCPQSTVALAAVLLSVRLHTSSCSFISDFCIKQLLSNLRGLIVTEHNAEFRIIYVQLEKLYKERNITML